MNKHFLETIQKAGEATGIFEIETIQNLWSGYGSIVRYGLENSSLKSVVVKHVRLPEGSSHPRGWNTDLSHERKIKSYKVETAWYKQWSHLSDEGCRIPKCLALETIGDEVLMVMEDMDEAGFPERLSSVIMENIETCIDWLANFHATFLNEKPANLWQVGTYWHLDTCPDEWEIMKNDGLKKAAKEIDLKLQNSPFQTFVHGDAKLANFCFSEDGKQVSAVDFQYVGGGCGMKDLAYFIGSCLYEDDCEQLEEQLLDSYFQKLRTALKKTKKQVDADALEKNWRELYPVAWTDFHRFLKGWSPDHWKINSYSERLAREVVSQLKSKTA